MARGAVREVLKLVSRDDHRLNGERHGCGDQRDVRIARCESRAFAFHERDPRRGAFGKRSRMGVTFDARFASAASIARRPRFDERHVGVRVVVREDRARGIACGAARG